MRILIDRPEGPVEATAILHHSMEADHGTLDTWVTDGRRWTCWRLDAVCAVEEARPIGFVDGGHIHALEGYP